VPAAVFPDGVDVRRGGGPTRSTSTPRRDGRPGRRARSGRISATGPGTPS